MNAEIGKNIKLMREKFNYSQADIADYLGVKQREMISYYENGEREIPIEKLNKLSDLFGIELVDLLEENPELMKANTAFAFRAEEIDSSDLNEIAAFRKIVKNYIKMNKLEQNETK